MVESDGKKEYCLAVIWSSGWTYGIKAKGRHGGTGLQTFQI